MTKIGIEINGALRDTISKYTELYEKHLVDTHFNESTDKTYEIEFSGDTDEVIELNENLEINNFEYKVFNLIFSFLNIWRTELIGENTI